MTVGFGSYSSANKQLNIMHTNEILPNLHEYTDRVDTNKHLNEILVLLVNKMLESEAVQNGVV